MRAGESVVYVGLPDERTGLAPGMTGRALQCTAAYTYVQWPGLGAQGVGLHPNDDLQAVSRPLSAVHASLNDSLEVGDAPSALTFLASAEEVYDSSGPQALVEHLTTTGHLAPYVQLIEDVVQHVVARLQQDPVLAQLTALMDGEEADTVYRTAALALLKDLED